MDCSLPGSSICGIFQARVLQWVAISFSRGSSQPRDQTWVSPILGRFFTIWATREDCLLRKLLTKCKIQSVCDLGTPLAPHSSTLAWKIPWTQEPGGLQSMGSRRVRHDWTTSLSLFTLCIGEGNGNPLSVLAWRIPGTGGAWWAAIYGVAQSRTRLKWLSRPTGKPWQDGFMAITFFFPLKGCLFIYF